MLFRSRAKGYLESGIGLITTLTLTRTLPHAPPPSLNIVPLKHGCVVSSRNTARLKSVILHQRDMGGGEIRLMAGKEQWLKEPIFICLSMCVMAKEGKEKGEGEGEGEGEGDED